MRANPGGNAEFIRCKETENERPRWERNIYENRLIWTRYLTLASK